MRESNLQVDRPDRVEKREVAEEQEKWRFQPFSYERPHVHDGEIELMTSGGERDVAAPRQLGNIRSHLLLTVSWSTQQRLAVWTLIADHYEPVRRRLFTGDVA